MSNYFAPRHCATYSCRTREIIVFYPAVRAYPYFILRQNILNAAHTCCTRTYSPRRRRFHILYYTRHGSIPAGNRCMTIVLHRCDYSTSRLRRINTRQPDDRSSTAHPGLTRMQIIGVRDVRVCTIKPIASENTEISV